MGAYNQGGGGGRSGTSSTVDQFAFDQPFEISGQFNTATANQINDMFRILFKALRRTEDKITSIAAQTSSDILSASIIVPEASFEVMLTTPVQIIVAPGLNKAAVPTLWCGYVNTLTAYSNTPLHRLSYADDVAASVGNPLCTALDFAENSIRASYAWGDAIQGDSFFSNGRWPANQAVMVSTAADLTGAGVIASPGAVYTVWYRIVDIIADPTP